MERDLPLRGVRKVIIDLRLSKDQLFQITALIDHTRYHTPPGRNYETKV